MTLRARVHLLAIWPFYSLGMGLQMELNSVMLSVLVEGGGHLVLLPGYGLQFATVSFCGGAGDKGEGRAETNYYGGHVKD